MHKFVTMNFSIIVPVFNVERYIERCITSIESQDLDSGSYEVIAVNDGSTDNSLKILIELSNTYSNLRIISQENKGLSEARNTGMRSAKGDYIMFVDSDDWIQENCLNRIITVCEEDNLDLLRICAANVINGVAKRRFSLSNREGIITGRSVIGRGYFACAPFTIYKRSFLEEYNLSFYPDIFHEDNEFTPRVYYYAQRVEEIDDIIYYVYQNPNSITRTVNPKKSFDNIIVAERLLEFANDKDDDWKNITSHLVVRSLNGSLHDSLKIDRESKKILANELYSKRYLFRCYRTEKRLLHRIQGALFSIFPRWVPYLYGLFK